MIEEMRLKLRKIHGEPNTRFKRTTARTVESWMDKWAAFHIVKGAVLMAARSALTEENPEHFLWISSLQAAETPANLFQVLYIQELPCDVDTIRRELLRAIRLDDSRAFIDNCRL